MSIKKYPLAGILVIAGFCCSGREPGIEKRVSVEFQDDFVITSVDTGPKHLLARPYWLALDSQNQLYVLDLDDSDVKVFDERGHFIRVIGRFGEGPGELDHPTDMDIVGDELAVGCSAARRLTYFSLRDGKYVRMMRLPDSISRFRFDSKGNLYAVVTNTSQRTVQFRKYDSDLKYVRTFISREWLPPNYFQTSDWFEVRDDDSILYAYPINHEYKILVFDVEGNIVDTIQKDYVPVPISAEDRVMVENMMKRTPGVAGAFDRIPEFYEPFWSMRTDEAGRILVATRIQQSANKVTYDAFSPNGEYLLTFDLGDSESNSIFWGHGRFYSGSEDADGNPTIRVRKVIWKE